MASLHPDPYRTLGVSPGVSDEQLRSAYRRLVQLHHPDHNGGSADSTRRFEDVQDAYARILELRRSTPGSGPPPAGVTADPKVESRIADLERELREAQLDRQRAQRQARDAAAESAGRPSDEELGYVTTDDSFSKILADARSELSDRFTGARDDQVLKRVGDLIDELDELASKLAREPPPR